MGVIVGGSLLWDSPLVVGSPEEGKEAVRIHLFWVHEDIVDNICHRTEPVGLLAFVDEKSHLHNSVFLDTEAQVEQDTYHRTHKHSVAVQDN